MVPMNKLTWGMCKVLLARCPPDPLKKVRIYHCAGHLAFYPRHMFREGRMADITTCLRCDAKKKKARYKAKLAYRRARARNPTAYETYKPGQEAAPEPPRIGCPIDSAGRLT